MTLEPYVSHFDVEKAKMAHVRAICGGLVGPKSGNVKNRWVSPLLFEGSRAREDSRESLQRSEPDR